MRDATEIETVALPFLVEYVLGALAFAELVAAVALWGHV